MRVEDSVPVWARRRFQRLLSRGFSADAARRIVMPPKRRPAEGAPRSVATPTRYPVLVYSSNAA